MVYSIDLPNLSILSDIILIPVSSRGIFSTPKTPESFIALIKLMVLLFGLSGIISAPLTIDCIFCSNSVISISVGMWAGFFSAELKIKGL